MIKRNIRIIILVNEEEKGGLDKEADQLGLPLSVYCRMILIKSLAVCNNEK
jgi:hypothetical protein